MGYRWLTEDGEVVTKERLTFVQRRADGEVAAGFSTQVPIAGEFEVEVRWETAGYSDSTAIGTSSS